MNFFDQGLPLGRWFRISVVIHWTFLLYAGFELVRGGLNYLGINALMMGLLFATVLVHEFGHALSCKAVGGEANQIILWPLGGIAFVNPPMNPAAWLITTACGPLVNAVFWPVFYLASRFLVVHQYGPDLWDAIDRLYSSADGLVPPPTDLPIATQICMLMWQINKMLLLFNLIPAYPMDGGRLLQELLWTGVGYARSLMIAGMVGTVAGVGFIVLGLGLRSFHIPGANFTLGNDERQLEPILILIGYLCATQSFGIYRRSQEVQSWRKN